MDPAPDGEVSLYTDFASVPDNTYDVILSDPPWFYFGSPARHDTHLREPGLAQLKRDDGLETGRGDGEELRKHGPDSAGRADRDGSVPQPLAKYL